MLIAKLPTELFLLILSNLPLQDIYALQLAGRIFTDFIRTNEGSIYHAAAILHNFAPRCTSLDTVTRGLHWLSGVTNWKAFCRRQFTLEVRWHGQTKSPQRYLEIGRVATSEPRVFRIDEEEGTVILFSSEGRIWVVSIETDKVLWELNLSYVARYPLIDWSNGFLVLELIAPSHRFEVWRRSLDAWDPQKYLPCEPTPGQLRAVSLHAPTFPPASESSNPGGRGVYVPFCVFQAPSRGIHFRVVYPDLVFASSEARKAYIWDIPSSRLIETIDIIPHAYSGAFLHNQNPFIYYVEINKDHVLVCWGNAMVAYPRRQSEDKVNYGCFSISNIGAFRPKGILGSCWHDLPYFESSGAWDTTTYSWELSSETSVQARRLIHDPMHVDSTSAISFRHHFSKVLVSPDGKDLVAVTSIPAWLVYIRDFQTKPDHDYEETRSFRLFLSEYEAKDLAFDGRHIVVRYGHPRVRTSPSLALDSELYLMVSTLLQSDADETTSSLRAITLTDRRNPIELLNGFEPLNPTIISFDSLRNGIQYSSCIQLAGTRIYMTYPQSLPVDEDEGPDLCITYVEMDEAKK